VPSKFADRADPNLHRGTNSRGREDKNRNKIYGKLNFSNKDFGINK
jgi:hypothetical protein